MSFFTDEEQASLSIKRMIFHVVGSKEFHAMPERALEGRGSSSVRSWTWQRRRFSASRAYRPLEIKSRRSPTLPLPSNMAPEVGVELSIPSICSRVLMACCVCSSWRLKNRTPRLVFAKELKKMKLGSRV